MSAPMAQVSRLNKMRLEKQLAEKQKAMPEPNKTSTAQNEKTVASQSTKAAEKQIVRSVDLPQSKQDIVKALSEDPKTGKSLIRLQKIITKNFGKKTFVGYILITDEEFSLLLGYLKERYRQAVEYMEWFRPAWEELSDDERFVLDAFYHDENTYGDRAVELVMEKYYIKEIHILLQ